MRISTRLALLLGAAFAAIMAVYAAATLHQRLELLRNGLIAETETLAATLRIVTNNAVRDRRFHDLDQVFQEVVGDPETTVAAVIDSRGRVVAGGVTGDPACLRRILPRVPVSPEGERGWAECGSRLRWVVLPATPPAASVVLARRATLIEREVAATRRRLTLLTLLLSSAAALIVHLVLRRTLSAPLAAILRGIRAVGGSGPPQQIRVPPSAGELHHLAGAFNAMVTELDVRQRQLLREAEERVALERRLGEAERFALIGRVSGGLAHELGSPLNVISIRAEGIAADPGVTPASRRFAEGIIGEVQRITKLVEGLLHVGRRRGIEPEAVDLREVVEGVVEHAAPHARAADVRLEAGFPDRPVVVRGQATLLRHALLNLERNALHALAATPPGERRLRIALSAQDDVARVEVEDNGPGISPEHLPHVFEPFFTTKEVGEGTGLGLAISHGIVEEHGGSLRLEPVDGGGVRVIVTIPLDRNTAAGEVA